MIPTAYSASESRDVAGAVAGAQLQHHRRACRQAAIASRQAGLRRTEIRNSEDLLEEIVGRGGFVRVVRHEFDSAKS